MKIFTAIAAAAAALVVATSAYATTFVYGLTDHPGGNQSSNFDYGLRLDTQPTGGTWANGPRFFTFGNLSNVGSPPAASDFTAFLVYDSVAATAEILGTMRESLGVGVFGDTYNVSYVLGSVNVETTGGTANGFFHDTSGNNRGSLSNGSETIDLLTASRGNGEYFNFDNAIRGFLGGEGWVGGVPANDFLFTATFLPGGLPQNPPPVPLPAAGWMLLAGFGAMGAMRRRRKAS